jgi:CHAT domain-containing protein
VDRCLFCEESTVAARFHTVSRELDAIDYKGLKCEDLRGLSQKSKDVQAERTRLLERLRVSDPRWRRLSVPVPLDLQTVLARLSKQRQAALNLFYDEPALTCVSLWNGELRCARLKMTSKVREQLATYQANLLKHVPAVALHDLSGTLGIKASDLVPAELLDVLTKAKSLVVVPHGPLHLVPWASLLHQGRRLFEYLPVSILPCLSLLADGTTASKPTSVDLLGVAAYPDLPGLPPLPSTGDELADIRDVYRAVGIPVRVSPLGHEDTTSDYRDRGRDLSGPGHALHLSCHGTQDIVEPTRSALWLADGKLDAATIAETPTPFEEIVLSACYTGWRPGGRCRSER